MTFEEVLSTEKIGEKKYIQPHGNDEAKIVVVTSHPSFDCLKEGGVLLGEKDKDELEKALQRVGLSYDDCWFTSIVKHKIPAKKPTAKQIKDNLIYFETEIKHIKPKLIVCLGAEAWKAVIKKPWKVGDFTAEVVNSPFGKCLYCPAPFSVYGANPKTRPLFQHAIEYAKQYAYDELSFTPFTWLVVKDPSINKAILEYYISQDKFEIGVDYEWLPGDDNKEFMTTCQYSMEDGKAIVLDIGDLGGEENLELFNTMNIIFDHPKCKFLGWNIRAELKASRKRGMNIRDECIAFDGMKAVQFIDSRLTRGLETGITHFTNYEHYYVEFYEALKANKIPPAEMVKMKATNPDLYYKYCAGDAVSHFTACRNMMQVMEEHVSENARRTYYDVFLPLTVTLTDLELNGLPVDVETMQHQTEQYAEIFEIVEKTIIDLAAKNGLEDYNPAAWQDRNKLFFDTLGLNPGYYAHKSKIKCRAWYDKAKKGVQDRCNPSSNNKSLATSLWDIKAALKEEPSNEELLNIAAVLQAQLDYNRINAVLNKPLSKQGIKDADAEILKDDTVEEEEDEEPLKASYWTALCSDSKIHASFYECLANFRCSSSPNMQNAGSKTFPAVKEIYKRIHKDFPEKQSVKSIRNCFWSGHKDYEWYEIDVSGADAAICSLLAKDTQLITDIRSGNFHLTRAQAYFKKPDLDKSKDVNLYVCGKALTFRIFYSAELLSAAVPIQADIYAEQGLWLDIPTIEYALNTWKNYKQYMSYRKTLTDMVDNYGYVEMGRGIKYYYGETNDPGIKASWHNESLALPVAGELAFFMHDVSNQIRKQLIKDKVWGKYVFNIGYIHDACYYTAHKDLRKDNYLPALMEQIFCHDVKIVTGDNLGMELVVSDRWKGRHSFEKETKFNFQTNQWE